MAMKAYESYKDTEYDWLPRIPTHWTRHSVREITSVSSERNENAFSRNDLLSVYREYGVIKKFSRDDNHNVESLDLSKYKTVHKNYLVINKMKMWQGSLGISKYDGIVSPAYIVCKLNLANVNYQFIHALLRAATFKTFYNRISYGVRVGQWDASYEDLKPLNLYLPPKKEQDQIVRYLDWQNSRLNKLINAKKKEIALLEEQKQALISQAVTKGLDPHAPLKDSGIDWIGQIPEHWEINRLKDVSTLKTGSTPKTQFTEYFNGDIPWFTPGDFSSNILNTAERTLTQKAKFDGAATIIPPNSILLICIGGTVGKVGLSPIECSCNQQITAFTNLKCDSKYLLYWLLGNKVHLKGTASYTTLPILNNQTVGNYPFIAPYEFTIQHEIANHLDKKCFTIDAAINNINKTISFLQEYRTRLVADVVTGQIDVRNIAIPNYETVAETADQPETTEDDSAISAEDQ